jgi:hypothetical protein
MSELEGTGLATWELPGGRRRIVIRLDDGRFALTEAVGQGRARSLFAPCTLQDAVTYAERVICGDAAAISHPRGLVVLATLAVLHTIVREADHG